MSMTNSTAGPLTVRELLDLDQDPRPGALHRALTGLDDDRLRKLETRITAVLPGLSDRQHEDLAPIRAQIRSVIRNRQATDTYAYLLAEAV